MNRRIGTLLTLLLLSSLAWAQEEVQEQIVIAKNLLAQGNIRHDHSLLVQGWGVMERLHEAYPSPTTLYFLAQAEHELVRYGVSRPGTDVYDRYVDRAIEHAEKLVGQRRDWSEALALLSSLYGMKISRSWIQAPILGPKAASLADKAVECDSTNPRAWLVRGMMKLNTPGFFGGSAEEAARSFERSAELFESGRPSDASAPDWGYLDALAWLGRAYEKLQRPEAALAVYRKALEVEPEFRWVKFGLLPQLEKKTQESRTGERE